MLPSSSASAITITASGGLTSGLFYFYGVVVNSGTGASLISNVVSMRPTATTAQGSKLAWTAVTQATSYTVYRATASANTSGLNFYGSSLLITQAGTSYNDGVA